MILPDSGSCAKLLMGPTVPRPGPIPAIHVAAELEADTGSIPVKTRISDPAIKMNRYKITKDRIEILVFSAILFPFNLMKEMDFG